MKKGQKKDDKIEQFKRDLKSLRYYEQRIIELEQELECISRVLYEAKTQHYGESKGNKQINKIEFMEIEDKLCKSISVYSSLRDSIKNKLNLLDECDMSLLMDMFVVGRNHYKIAEDRNVSRSKLYRDVDNIIEKLLKLEQCSHESVLL